MDSWLLVPITGVFLVDGMSRVFAFVDAFSGNALGIHQDVLLWRLATAVAELFLAVTAIWLRVATWPRWIPPIMLLSIYKLQLAFSHTGSSPAERKLHTQCAWGMVYCFAVMLLAVRFRFAPPRLVSEKMGLVVFACAFVVGFLTPDVEKIQYSAMLVALIALLFAFVTSVCSPRRHAPNL